MNTPRETFMDNTTLNAYQLRQPNGQRKSSHLMSLTLALVVVLSLLFVFAGCAAPVSGSGTTTTAAAAATVAGVTTDPEQPVRTVDIYGRVKTIQGNVMVVEIMVNQTATSETLTAEQKAAKQAAMQALSDEERAKAKAAAQTLTGESVTVVIPVGIPIKSKASQLDGGLIKPVAMTAIIPGSIISVWTEDSAKTNRVNAEYVRISAA